MVPWLSNISPLHTCHRKEKITLDSPQRVFKSVHNDHKRISLHFHPGDPNDLAIQVVWIPNHPAELALMRKEARAEYEARYTAERNYEMLMEIYKKAGKHWKRYDQRKFR